jgi:S-adenosyl-L-methionine hydrolase (adenosine-forming)
MPIVTLTTDFGDADGYVGAMKGVLCRLADGATVVDLVHHVPRHDVAHGAWVLATAAFEFPPGTVHVAVVDPGVGGARPEVVVAARGHLFVGPDNGLFAHVARDGVDGVWAIAAPDLRAPDVSPTFHGRDVFAPAAAALARGLGPERVGPATSLTGALPWRHATRPGAGVIVHVDVFGNLISDLACAVGARGRIRIAGHTVPLVGTYEDVAPGELLAYVGSARTIEVAVRDRDAAQVLGFARGEELEVELAP